MDVLVVIPSIVGTAKIQKTSEELLSWVAINLRQRRNDIFFRKQGVFRSSHPEVFLGKGVLKIRSKFTAEHTCRSVISVKLLSNFIEIFFRYGCFPVNVLDIFRTPFRKNTSGVLLLEFFDIVWQRFIHNLVKHLQMALFKKLHQQIFSRVLNALLHGLFTFCKLKNS